MRFVVILYNGQGNYLSYRLTKTPKWLTIITDRSTKKIKKCISSIEKITPTNGK